MKVLVMSGCSVGGGQGHIIDAGAAGFMAKPFRFNELLALTRKILDEPPYRL